MPMIEIALTANALNNSELTFDPMGIDVSVSGSEAFESWVKGHDGPDLTVGQCEALKLMLTDGLVIKVATDGLLSVQFN